jgi:transglutaminase-like putative cysteine protease
MVGIVALWTAQIVRPTTAVAGLILVPLGSVFSWAVRRRDNWEVKLVLTLGIVVAFGTFIRAILRVGLASISDTIEPLAELMVWVQVLHSFDLPGRRDLYFSVAAAVSMVAAGAVDALTDTYAWVVLAFGIAAALALRLGHLSELSDVYEVRGGTVLVPEAGTRPSVAGDGAGGAGTIVRGARAAIAFLGAFALVTAATMVTYAAVPRFRTGRVIKLPFSIGPAASYTASDGFRIETPGLSEATASDGRTVVEGGYFGFANRMDLAVRGRPGDEIVMRVRADRPAFWRGLAYSTYDGRYWHADPEPPKKLESQDNEIFVPGPSVPSGSTTGSSRKQRIPREELIQTFYIETPQPNLVFAAYRASRIFFPAAYVRMDREESFRTPIEMEAGTVYSVVSTRLKVEPEQLDSVLAGANIPEEISERYLQVPETVPERVRSLARQLGEGRETIVSRVRSVESWLMHNTEYTLDIPELGPGEDAVDRFLFVDRKGFCEQIASAEVILLRLMGVPARLVSGYVPGERSFFSGMFEVRGRDAHTWTEVYFPGVGWVEFDPTYVVPPSGAFATAKQLGNQLQALYAALPAPMRQAISSGVRFLGGVRRLEAAPTATLALCLLAVVTLIYWTHRVRERRRLAALSWEERTLEKLERVGKALGIKRLPSETPREFARRLQRAFDQRFVVGKDGGEGTRLRASLGAPGAASPAEIADRLDSQIFGLKALDPEEAGRTEAAADILVSATNKR